LMLFALVCAALLLVVLGVLVLPLLIGTKTLPERGQYDRAVYSDQLREVDRDVARGVLNSGEAGAARLEIQRRLLAVDASGGKAAMKQTRSPLLATAAAVFVLVGAGGLYWQLGAPNLPDAPLSAVLAAQATQAKAPAGSAQAGSSAAAAGAASPHVDMQAAAEQLQKKLQANPSDAEGWILYARTESTLGDWGKATDAYQHAIDLGQKGADVYAGYGEMLVLAAGGIVSPAARDAFVTARAADPKGDVARYYLALADSQAGNVRPAIAAWLALAADIPNDSPMRDAIQQRIAEAAQSGGIAAPPMPKGTAEDESAAAQPAPTPDQMQAAENMPPAERDKMINDMVAQLAAKLQTNPNDADGWLRLGGAYAAQGKTDQALDAYDHAAKLKPDDPSIKLQAAAALLAPLQPSDPLPPRAVELLHEASLATPQAPEVLWYLGVVAAREGRPAEARQDWTKLLIQLPNNSDDYKMVNAAIGELKGP
jgi:cytochrome c-type biogenesis protein CcmH